MSSEPSFGHLDAGGEPVEAPGPDTPFRIAVLADFSGRASRGEAAGRDELARRRLRPLDPEDFDATLGALGVSLRLDGLDGGDVDLAFTTLDEFHPDELYRQVDRFSDLDGDEERTAFMRQVLHHPRFQALEAAWRGVDWLARRARKADSKVEIVLCDVTRDELEADLNASDDLGESALYNLLVEQATKGPKGKPWALLVGDYVFEADAAGAQTLGRMAKVAREACAPFLTGATARLFDKEYAADAAAWTALRRLSEAALLGVALPRFLLRLPYGEKTKSIERFEFEEWAREDKGAGYLWGNAALGVAALLAQSFQKEGWALKPGGQLGLGDMALHAYRDEDDDEQVTLVEVWAERKGAERLTALGLMTLLGVRGRDQAQFGHVASVAQAAKDQPPTPLPGRWGQKGTVTLPRAAKPLSVAVSLAAPADTPAEAPADEEPEAPPPPAAPAEAPADEEMDPELAALMAEMDAPAPVAAEKAPAAPADEGMDPELAALMAQMDEPAPAAEEKAPAAPAAEEEMDPELAALLKQMEEP